MNERHFQTVRNPRHRRRHRHIAQNQPPARTQDAENAVEKRPRVGVVVETLGTDKRVKAVVRILSRRSIRSISLVSYY